MYPPFAPGVVQKLTEAVTVLNRFRHGGSMAWYVYPFPLCVRNSIEADPTVSQLEPSEAESLAEQYLSDQSGANDAH